MRVLLETQRKNFGGINIGDLNKIISCMCLNLHLRVNFNVDVLPKWYSRYGNQSVSVEYLPIFAYICPIFSWTLTLTGPFLANSTCSNFVSHSFHIWLFSCWSWLSNNKINCDVKKNLLCRFSLNTEATPLLYNCSLTRKMTHNSVM